MTPLMLFGIRIFFVLHLFLILTSCQALKGLKEKKEIKQLYSDFFDADQKYRWMIMYGTINQPKIDSLNRLDMQIKAKIFSDVSKDENGVYKNIKDSLWTLQSRLDSLNYIKLIPTLKKHGIPKYIDKNNLMGLFSHIPTRYENDVLPILLQELKKGNIIPIQYAQIIDYIEIKNSRPQKYMSRKTIGKKLEINPKTCTDININRKKIGLIELNFE